MEICGKNAIITGGCNGIGYAIARELLKAGVKVIGLFDINHNNNSAKILQNDFNKQIVEYHRTDVRSKESMVDSFTEFLETHHFVDIVVVNAGVFNERNPKELIDVNLLGAIQTIEIAMDFMSTFSGNGRGGIIAITAGIASLCFIPIYPIYCATKHAILAYAKSMATVCSANQCGIKIVSVCPGGTDTTISHPLKDKIKPELHFLVEKYRLSNKQKPEILAKVYVDVLKIGENGSVWTIDHGELEEYHIVEKPQFN